MFKVVEGNARIGLATFLTMNVKPKIPLLIKNAIPGFGAGWKWSPDELLKRTKESGRSKTQVSCLEPTISTDNIISQYNSKKRRYRLEDTLERFRMSDSSGERIQSRLDPSLFWLEHEQIPNLLTDMDILFDNSFVWLTSRGLRTPLHSDPDHGCLMQLYGQKRIVLISPATSDKPDILKSLMTYRERSGTIYDLYENNPDPIISQVNKYFADLEEGDMIYIPQRWLHDVESNDRGVTTSIAVRFKY